MVNLGVKAIKQVDERTLGITWSDDKYAEYDVVNLRRKCPCALCVDEWTRAPKLDPKQITEDIRPIRIDSVGRYALKIKFNDGHTTGIYTFQLLRDLDETSLH